MANLPSQQGRPGLNQRDQLILESIFNPNTPFDEVDTEGSNTQPLAEDATEVIDAELKALESQAVKAAEEGEFDKALATFNEVIERKPERAAAYNNRAQLYRLTGNVESAKSDLEMALVKSSEVGPAACQAFIQRAMIRRLEGDDDGCRADFSKAADLGSKFAKQQLVNLNPYAALCNTMLSEMMCKIKRGEPEDSGDIAA